MTQGGRDFQSQVAHYERSRSLSKFVFLFFRCGYRICTFLSWITLNSSENLVDSSLFLTVLLIHRIAIDYIRYAVLDWNREFSSAGENRRLFILLDLDLHRRAFRFECVFRKEWSRIIFYI